MTEDIYFAVRDCFLGSILIAMSQRGICAIFLGDDPGTLVRELHNRFPRTSFIEGNQYNESIAKVMSFVESPRLGLNLPLDIRGTAFQQRVWQALKEIPGGSTASYSEVASKIGAPKAARAVARACATNALAIVIPCHRVVRNDGALSGYHWGVRRKQILLEREAKE